MPALPTWQMVCQASAVGAPAPQVRPRKIWLTNLRPPARGSLPETTAAAAGITAPFVQVAGEEPASVILSEAEARGCDLIVMSSHAREGLGRLVLGSQTSKVLAHSSVPVLVVR